MLVSTRIERTLVFQSIQHLRALLLSVSTIVLQGQRRTRYPRSVACALACEDKDQCAEVEQNKQGSYQ